MMPSHARVGPNYEASEDFPSDLTPEEAQASEKELRFERLQDLGARLAAQRDEWINARKTKGWDKRVQEDIDQYHAKDRSDSDSADMMASVRAGVPVTRQTTATTRSTVFIGLTRQKTNAAEARLSDVVLPTDELNWAAHPTPKPEIAQLLISEQPGTMADLAAAGAGVQPTNDPVMLNALRPDGTIGPVPAKKKDIALAAEKIARERAHAMQDLISDQLVECDMNSVERKVIHDAAVMGTGVLKGPVVMNKTRRSWQKVNGGVYQLIQVEERTPASYHVDPRLVWEDPDCGDDIQNGKGIYELSQKTRKKVRELTKQPGYIPEQISYVLKEGPKRGEAIGDLMQHLEHTKYQKNTFDVWEYTGELDVEDLLALGVEGVDPESQLDVMSGCVVMINDTVVKIYLNPLETGELPYDFYPWEKVTDSPRGYGVPYLMRAPQRVINAAWRMMMDNAAICSGPQIIIKKDKILPEDKTYKLYSRKVWLFNGAAGESVNDAFTQVEFNMHQAELAAIIKLGMDLADAETSTPMITQGEQGAAPETVGGMQMLLNSANVVLRRLVKQFDDYVTKPHIRRYYDYNMAYSDDESVKGDFDIDARGSSALLVRDIQNQAFTNLLAAGSNPVFAKFIDPKKLFEKALTAQHIQPQDVMKTDEQIAQEEELARQNPAPQDPRIQAAMINAQSRQVEAQARAEADTQEVVLRKEIAEDNHLRALAELELRREIALLNYARDNKVTLDNAKKDLAIAAMRERGKTEQLQTPSDGVAA